MAERKWIRNLSALFLGAAVSTVVPDAESFMPPPEKNGPITQAYGYGIVLEGTPWQVKRFQRWVDTIAQTPVGQETLQAMRLSGRQLIVRHDEHAVIASGRTLAPATEGLINGRGESAEILFNANIPDSGSHNAYNASGEKIKFTAVQNLFHELAHAMHYMNGTWRYFDSEGQAIRMENIFREQLAKKQDVSFERRSGIEGEPICNYSPYAGMEYICQLKMSR